MEDFGIWNIFIQYLNKLQRCYRIRQKFLVSNYHTNRTSWNSIISGDGKSICSEFSFNFTKRHFYHPHCRPFTVWLHVFLPLDLPATSLFLLSFHLFTFISNVAWQVSSVVWIFEDWILSRFYDIACFSTFGMLRISCISLYAASCVYLNAISFSYFAERQSGHALSLTYRWCPKRQTFSTAVGFQLISAKRR